MAQGRARRAPRRRRRASRGRHAPGRRRSGRRRRGRTRPPRLRCRRGRRRASGAAVPAGVTSWARSRIAEAGHAGGRRSVRRASTSTRLPPPTRAGTRSGGRSPPRSRRRAARAAPCDRRRRAARGTRPRASGSAASRRQLARARRGDADHVAAPVERVALPHDQAALLEPVEQRDEPAAVEPAARRRSSPASRATPSARIARTL